METLLSAESSLSCGASLFLGVLSLEGNELGWIDSHSWNNMLVQSQVGV